MPALFKQVDCIELYVPNLDEGIRYYRDSLGLKLLWRAHATVGLGMENGDTEIVLQTDRRMTNVDLKVDSVADAVEAIRKAGGKVVDGPFDIPIGKCAVVQDKWENQYVILDMTKGRYITDESGNVMGLAPEK